jgi:hypothetical protein
VSRESEVAANETHDTDARMTRRVLDTYLRIRVVEWMRHAHSSLTRDW